MLGKEEIVGLQGLNGGIEGVIVEENGAKDGALGVEIAG
jgi:hypothetical protein